MKLIHLSDTHLGFNDLDTLNYAVNRWCISKPFTYATHFYLKTIILEYCLLCYMAILKTFDEVFGSQDESRRMEILEAFHTIKEQYRQIFLISHEMEIKEMFERVVEV